MSQDQTPPVANRSLLAQTPFWIQITLIGMVPVALYVGFDWSLVGFSAVNLSIIARNPWQFPWAAARGLGVAAAMLAGLFGLGYGLLSGLRPWRRMLPLASERAALALPVAAVPVSLVVLALGLAGLARPAAYGALIGTIFLAGLPGWWLFARELRAGAGAALARTLKAQPPWVLALLAALLGLALVYSLSPSVESDELRYHLAAPATWLRDGKIHYLPYQAFSNFPMLGEMLFMAAMAVGGEEAAKPLHLAFLPVTMMLVGLLALRVRGRGSVGSVGSDRSVCRGHTFLAGAAFAFMPMVPILGAWGFIDLFVTAYFLAFVYLTGRALARPGRAAGSLIGLVAGGGCGVKYTLPILLGALGGLWCVGLLMARSGRRVLARLAIAVVALTLLCAGPWYVKNAVWTGNPVYPLAWGIFHGGEWSADNAVFFLQKAHNRTGMPLAWPGGAAGRVLELLVSPFAATFYPERFEENPLGPLPLMALLLCVGWLALRRVARASCLHRLRMERDVRIQLVWFTAAAVISWIAWFASYQSNRFLLPTAGIVLALGARAAAQWMRDGPCPARLMLRALYLLAAVYATLFTVTQILGTNKVGAVGVALGFEERDDHLAYRLNYYKAAQWLARRARPGERALLVGEYHTMHFKLQVVASDFFDTPQPLPWLRATKNNDEMLDGLRAAGVRFVFYNRAELSLYEKMFLSRFGNDAERGRFRELWNNPRLRQIYPAAEREGIFIFEIVP